LEIESTWIERFYTHFLGRDLAYVAGGGLLIIIFQYTFWYEIKFPQNVFIQIAAFIIASYCIGLAVSEFSDLIGLIRKKPKSPFGNSLIFYQKLSEHYNEYVIIRYERTMNLLHLGASFGVSALWSSLLLLITALIRCIFSSEPLDLPPFYFVISVLLFLYGLYMGPKYTRWKTSQIERYRCEMIESINSIKKTDKKRKLH